MKKAKIKILKGSPSYPPRLQLRAGEKGTGRVLYEVPLWPTFGVALGRVKEYAAKNCLNIGS